MFINLTWKCRVCVCVAFLCLLCALLPSLTNLEWIDQQHFAKTKMGTFLYPQIWMQVWIKFEWFEWFWIWMVLNGSLNGFEFEWILNGSNLNGFEIWMVLNWMVWMVLDWIFEWFGLNGLVWIEWFELFWNGLELNGFEWILNGFEKWFWTQIWMVLNCWHCKVLLYFLTEDGLKIIRNVSK